MNAQAETRTNPLIWLLGLVAVGLLVAIFYAPVWWVSLTAPNYPPEAFPDGVRIHFHVNGVFNGCKKVKKTEIEEEEALNCVHEMDTINHYVGMYPIAAGAPIERALGQFLMVFLGIMVVGFVIPRPGVRLVVMGIAFAALALWMYLTFFGTDGLKYENEGYLSALVTALDQEANDESNADLSPGQELIRRLKASLAESEHKALQEETAHLSEREKAIAFLKSTYEHDRVVSGGRMAPWNGSAYQVIAWHYGKTLGRYFNDPRQIEPMVARLETALKGVIWGLMGAMLLLLWGARKNRGLLYWLLILVPIALPVFFVIDYSAWLWWFGHTLNKMGAFTVKPFMPTVFGNGKVAQFTTHSYPYIGFFLMLALSLVGTLIALLRRKALRGAS